MNQEEEKQDQNNSQSHFEDDEISLPSKKPYSQDLNNRPQPPIELLNPSITQSVAQVGLLTGKNTDNQSSLTQKSNHTFNTFTLKDYNKQRLTMSKGFAINHGSQTFGQKLSEANTSQNQDNLKTNNNQDDLSQQEIDMTTDIQENRFKNINISLFWEEKIVLIIRYIQFYGYLMMVCFEVWPYQARFVWSHFFFFMTGSFYFMVGPDYYYDTLSSLQTTVINLGVYTISLLVVSILVILAIFMWKLHFRLLRNKKLYIFKWGFWFVELVYFPFLLNVIQYSTCQYYTQKAAIQVINLSRQNSTAYTLMLLCALLAFIIAICYNLLLGVHLYRESISVLLHEEYLRKKELEFTIGISEMWNTRYFYTFSSFKGELFKMYGRVIFNVLSLALILVHAVMIESTAKLGIITGIFALMTLYIIAMRPYRSVHTNIIYFILTCNVLITSFLLLLKKGGLNSALFVENYFYGLLIIINAFGWFILIAFVLLLLLTKRQWPLTRDEVLKDIEGLDLVIIYIKKAKKFVIMIFNSYRDQEFSRLRFMRTRRRISQSIYLRYSQISSIS